MHNYSFWPHMDEARTSNRRRVSRIGSISFGVTTITCTIPNLSLTGATLEVWSHFGIPDRFTLVIGMGKGQRLCSVVWRREKHIGVVFL
jgi:PilZ domain-containing protein